MSSFVMLIFLLSFFVLSGFVLAHTYGYRATFNFKFFLISRTFRLLPLHWVMLVIYIILELCKLIASHNGLVFISAPFSGPTAISEIIPNALLIQSWTRFKNPLSFNYPSWSISVEYYVYIIFAVILIFLSKIKHVVWLVISLVSIVFMCFGKGFVAYPSLKGLSCFFMGSLSYFLFDFLRRYVDPSYRIMTVFEISSLFLIKFILSSSVEGKSLLASCLFSAVVVLYAFDKGIVSRLLKGRFFLLLGKLSYSIYLTHITVLFIFFAGIIVADKILGSTFAPVIGGLRYFDSGSKFGNNSVFILVLIFIIVVSMFTYKHVEMKGQELGRTILRKAISKNETSLA